MEVTQQVAVAKNGVSFVRPAAAEVQQLGSPVRVTTHYAASTGSDIRQIHLVDLPIVMGGWKPATNIDITPLEQSNTYTVETTEFIAEYFLQISQTLMVWPKSGGQRQIVAVHQLVLAGKERTPEQLDSIPTAGHGEILWLPPSQPKVEFQLLVDPFGGWLVRKTARLLIKPADEREQNNLTVHSQVNGFVDAGRILDNGTGAAFIVSGFSEQMNYKLEFDVDGERKLHWQATTNTGPYFDQRRPKP